MRHLALLNTRTPRRPQRQGREDAKNKELFGPHNSGLHLIQPQCQNCGQNRHA